MKKPAPQALRPLNAPRPLRVRTSTQGRPLSICLKEGEKRVKQILEIWQIDDEWWRERISRRYATLALQDGQMVTVFRDLVTGRWYLQEG